MVKFKNNEMNISFELHKLFNNPKLPFYGFEDLYKVKCTNGIYIFFEKGEIYKNLKRIVRIGTNRTQGRFYKRLKDHYVANNKDGSIFRKNIGIAILNKRNDPYLKVWDKDTSNKQKFKKENPTLLNDEYQKEIEAEVSNYIINNVFFTYLEVENREIRLLLERKLIASIWRDIDFKPSDNWLGMYSTKNSIRECGLWLVQGLKSEPFTQDEFEKFYEYVVKHYNLK